jgi:hypothetical protein
MIRNFLLFLAEVLLFLLRLSGAPARDCGWRAFSRESLRFFHDRLTQWNIIIFASIAGLCKCLAFEPGDTNAADHSRKLYIFEAQSFRHRNLLRRVTKKQLFQL